MSMLQGVGVGLILGDVGRGGLSKCLHQARLASIGLGYPCRGWEGPGLGRGIEIGWDVYDC